MCCECDKLKEQLAKSEERVGELSQELKLLEQKIDAMRHRMFGASSEKFDPNQQTFAGLLKECDALNGAPIQAPAATQKIEYERAKPSANSNLNGRVKIPENLERVEKIVDLPDSEKICPVTGLPMIQIGVDVTETLAYKPGSFYVIRYVRPKYASPDRRKGESAGVMMAPLPDNSPIDRCKADSSLLAEIIVSKHCDGLPLYRQNGVFERQGVEIAESTLCDWTMGCADALHPLYMEIRRASLLVDYIHVDETPEPMIEKGKKHTVNGRMWAYRTGDGPPMVFFDFTDDKTQERPAGILKTFKGRVQTDAASSFNALFRRDGVFALGCWAHARRKFVEAFEIGVKEAEPFIRLINILYRIEHRMETLLAENPRRFSDSEVFLLRRKRAMRIMNRFFKKANSTPALPKSPMGKALTYARNQEAILREYVNDLRFKPDNNAVENAIRPLVIGRKNHLFVGSRRGGKAAAIFYSIIGTCKLNDVNPYEYLKDVLSRINSHPASKIGELLPPAWKKAQDAKAKA